MDKFGYILYLVDRLVLTYPKSGRRVEVDRVQRHSTIVGSSQLHTNFVINKKKTFLNISLFLLKYFDTSFVLLRIYTR